MQRLLFLLALAPSAISAQQSNIIALKPANGTLSDPLAVGQVRELHDGRVLVGGQGGLVIADFSKGTFQSIPNASRGSLVPLAGDSTLVAVQNMGWIFLDAEKVLGMLPLSNPVVKAAESPFPFSADRSGHVLSIAGGWPDSANAILIDRATNEQQRITRLWQSEPARGGIPAPVFVVNEQSVVALDGWIAVVRAHPYRVDWRMPSGEWIRGGPLPVPTILMDAREVDAYWAKFAPYRPDPSETHHWPKYVEPFTYPQPIATPDGKVLVRRNPSADAMGVRYDVINRRGELEGQIVLPSRRDQIAGFGTTSIYLVTLPDSTNPRRIQLERRPWP